MSGIEAAVTAVACGADLTLTAIGWGLAFTVSMKHNTKRIERLLGNKTLQRQEAAGWQAVSQAALPQDGPIVVLVDWIGAPDGSERFLLSASLPATGRAIRIYEKVALGKST